MVVDGNKIRFPQSFDGKIFSNAEPFAIGTVDSGKKVIIPDFSLRNRIADKSLIAAGQRIDEHHIGIDFMMPQKTLQAETAAQRISIGTAVSHDQHPAGIEKFLRDLLDHHLLTLRR